jgi:hypothetical protein
MYKFGYQNIQVFFRISNLDEKELDRPDHLEKVKFFGQIGHTIPLKLTAKRYKNRFWVMKNQLHSMSDRFFDSHFYKEMKTAAVL